MTFLQSKLFGRHSPSSKFGLFQHNRPKADVREYHKRETLSYRPNDRFRLEAEVQRVKNPIRRQTPNGPVAVTPVFALVPKGYLRAAMFGGNTEEFQRALLQRTDAPYGFLLVLVGFAVQILDAAGVAISALKAD